MLVTAAFAQYALAVHILAVVVAFGVVFSYPVFVFVGLRLDPTVTPWFHRMQVAIGRRIINPGLLVTLIAGIALASDEHQWKSFYVQWGLGAVVVIGAIEGAVMIRSEKRLAALAERDLAAGGLSDEYRALFRRTGAIGSLLTLLVVVTVFIMATRAGAA